MFIQLFDLDYNLDVPSDTKDIKDIYNEDAVNQSIDLWIMVPYRLGVGLTNNLAQILFADINVKTEEDIKEEILTTFSRFYSALNIDYLKVDSDPNNRRIFVSLNWSLKNYNLSGNYTRFWNE